MCKKRHEVTGIEMAPGGWEVSTPPDGHGGRPAPPGLSPACASFPHTPLQLLLALCPLEDGALSEGPEWRVRDVGTLQSWHEYLEAYTRELPCT